MLLKIPVVVNQLVVFLVQDCMTYESKTAFGLVFSLESHLLIGIDYDKYKLGNFANRWYNKAL